MDGSIFLQIVENSFNKYEYAFLQLKKQNDAGHIEVKRDGFELII